MTAFQQMFQGEIQPTVDMPPPTADNHLIERGKEARKGIYQSRAHVELRTNLDVDRLQTRTQLNVEEIVRTRLVRLHVDPNLVDTLYFQEVIQDMNFFPFFGEIQVAPVPYRFTTPYFKLSPGTMNLGPTSTTSTRSWHFTNMMMPSYARSFLPD